MKNFTVVLAVLLAAGCSSSPGDSDAGDSGQVVDTGVTDAGGAFTYYTLDSTVVGIDPLALTVGPQGQVGVAYFHRQDGGTQGHLLLADGGQDPQAIFMPDYQVRFVEWKGGTVSAPSTVQTVQRVAGVSLAYTSGGMPAVAYLGGSNAMVNSPYWFQCNAAVSYQLPGGTWAEYIAQQLSADNPDNPSKVDSSGFVVGLFPAIAFDSANNLHFTYRDVHNGQFPIGDWGGSDLKYAFGGPTANGGTPSVGGSTTWTLSGVAFGGNNKQAYGGHNQLVIANDQPAVVSDRLPNSALGTGVDVLFYRRTPQAVWTQPPFQNGLFLEQVGNTQTGPSLAWDPLAGTGGTGSFGIAYSDLGRNQLSFISTLDGVTASSWTNPDPVFGSGSGGWYPSLAWDPIQHEPSIAFYICSRASGVSEGSCTASQDEIDIAYRVFNNWRYLTVDTDGVSTAKIGFLPNGKRVVAYHLASGLLRLAVEK